ncbi:MAG: hypothetical protein HY863_11970 [Chloroflexi bacterium]|nr:hypothetical protein [Chloroflexota bacterium]
MKKTIPAIVAALLITMLVAGGMFAVGGQALLGSASAASDAAVVPAQVQTTDQTTQALQDQLAVYRARETQYQEQLKLAAQNITEANQQIELANQQIQQYQTLLTDLQNRGLITVAEDGTVSVMEQAFFPGGHHDGGNH